MLNLQTEKLELRGVENVTSKKGNVYYVLHCESMVGKHFSFFCNDADVIPPGLKKGSIVTLVLNYNSFKELVVKKITMKEG